MKNRVLKRIFGYGLKYPLLFTFSIVLAFFFVFAKVGAAFFATKYFSSAFIEKNLESSNILSILMLIGLAFAWVFFHYLIFVSSTSLAMNVMHDIRGNVYEKVLSLPMAYFKKNKLGDIISRLINDVQIIEVFFMNVMVELLIQPLTFYFLLILNFPFISFPLLL